MPSLRWYGRRRRLPYGTALRIRRLPARQGGRRSAVVLQVAAHPISELARRGPVADYPSDLPYLSAQPVARVGRALDSRSGRPGQGKGKGLPPIRHIANPGRRRGGYPISIARIRRNCGAEDDVIIEERLHSGGLLLSAVLRGGWYYHRYDGYGKREARQKFVRRLKQLKGEA